jgi:hypothetical protein
VGNHASDIRLRIDVEVQKVGFFGPLRRVAIGRGDDTRITCLYGERARRGSLVLYHSLIASNIARAARLALLEWEFRDIKFKSVEFDCLAAAVAFAGSGVGWHSKRSRAF